MKFADDTIYYINFSAEDCLAEEFASTMGLFCVKRFSCSAITPSLIGSAGYYKILL